MENRVCKLQEFSAHASDVRCLNIGKKSHRVFITGGEDRKVNLWAIGKSTCLLSLAGHASSVESLSFDSTEILVLAGSSNGAVKLWDLEEAKTVRTVTAHRSSCVSVGFHPFGEFFASGSVDTDLKIWDIRKKESIHTYKGHTGGVRVIKFTPDGRWVVTGGDDNAVKVWDLTAGKLLHDFKSHNALVTSIEFHPQEFLLATGSADRTVQFWDLETFELIGSSGPEATGVRSMIFHHDGRTLFCGLDHALKVLSWEPVRCHDVFNIGWSALADLSIYEGKLFGCSYHQSQVQVWVSDISLIEPYALRSVSNKSNAESTYSQGDSALLHLLGKTILSDGASITESLDFVDKTRATPESPHSTFDIKKVDDFNRSVSKENDTVTVSNVKSGFRSKKPPNIHFTPSKHDSKLSSRVSTVHSTSFRNRKTSDSSPVTLGKDESRFPSRNTLPSATKSSRSRPLTPKEGLARDEHLSRRALPSKEGQMKTLTSTRDETPISIPVVVPRDDASLESPASSRRVATITRNNASTMGVPLHKSVHTRSAAVSSMSSYSQSISVASQPLISFIDRLESPKIQTGPMESSGSSGAEEENLPNIRSINENSERSMSLEQGADYSEDKYDESSCSTSGKSSVKYVRGVGVQLGKTRSLVESWERRERSNTNCITVNLLQEQEGDLGPSISMQKGERDTSERSFACATEDDDDILELLIQNHDVFINAVKSRLTKLQMVRHLWQKDGIRGSINAATKLPDQSVHADAIYVLMEKEDILNLDLFLCLLPLLAGLLCSKTERHVTISLEMLLKLVKIFGSLIRSTRSAPLLVGVDLEAEKRLGFCDQCFSHLEKIKQMLPPLTSQGGLLGKHAQALNIALYDF